MKADIWSLWFFQSDWLKRLVPDVVRGKEKTVVDSVMGVHPQVLSSDRIYMEKDPIIFPVGSHYDISMIWVCLKIMYH